MFAYEKRKIIANYCKENKKVDYKRKHTPFYPFKPKLIKIQKFIIQIIIL